MMKHTIDFKKTLTTPKCLECSPMVKVSGKPTMRGMWCISRPSMAYTPKVWNHFITSRLILTTNVCKVTAKRALLNYVIIQDIPFHAGQVIEDAILHNKDAKMNLGYPFLIYRLCQKVGVPLESNEAWKYIIKEILVKKNKSGVP